MASGATRATVALAKAGVPHTLHSYEHDPRAHAEGLAYGLEAALALGIEPARVFKTLVADVDGNLAVAIVPVDTQVDLKALAGALKAKKAAMADPAAAQRATGYVIGGISPLGQKRALATVVDSTALEHGQILVSAGKRGLDVELAAADLVRLTRAIVAPIARGR